MNVQHRSCSDRSARPLSMPFDDESLSALELSNIRRLHQFVITVESGSQAAASRRLFITQQALSASLRHLEKELDVELFDRSVRRLRLTPAGEAAYEGAKPLLARSSALIAHVRRVAATNGAVTYVVGHDKAPSAPLLTQLLRRAIAEVPELAIDARRLPADKIVTQIEDRSIDLGLVLGSCAASLSSAIISWYTPRVAVSARSPLARRPSIPITALANSPMLAPTRDGSCLFTDYVVTACRQLGFAPELIVDTLEGLPVTAGLNRHPDAWTLVLGEYTPPDGATVLDLEDFPQIPLHALWLSGTSAAIRRRIVPSCVAPEPLTLLPEVDSETGDPISHSA